MSLSCQYDQVKVSNYLGDIVRQVSVEARLKIPETYPKLLRVKGGDFRAEAPVLTINEGLLTVSGKLKPHLIYLAEQLAGQQGEGANGAENAEELDAPIEYGISWNDEPEVSFEERIEIPGLTPDMLVEVDLKPGTALYEKTNPYETVFSGVLDVVVHTAVPHTLELVNDIATQPSGRINLGKEQVLVEELKEFKSTVIPVHSSLLLPNFKPGVHRILDYVVKPVGVSGGLFNGRVAVKGLLEVAVVYVGADDEGRPTEIFVNEWNRETETAIPFETYLDCEVAGRVLVEPKLTAKNLAIEQKNQRELRCQLDLECQAKVIQVQLKDVVVDVTSDSGEIIDTEKHMVNLEEFSEEIQGNILFELEADLPSGAPNIERLLNYRGTLEDAEVEVTENKLLFSGLLNVNLNYVSEGNDSQRLFQTCWGKASGNALTVTGALEGSGLVPGVSLRVMVALDSLKLEVVGSRSVKLTGNTKAMVVVKKPRALSVIQNCAIVTPVDPDTRPSMLFYIVQSGDTLWKIARKYQTTVEALARGNQLTCPYRLEPGQKLLIPKRIGIAVK